MKSNPFLMFFFCCIIISKYASLALRSENRKRIPLAKEENSSYAHANRPHNGDVKLEQAK